MARERTYICRLSHPGAGLCSLLTDSYKIDGKKNRKKEKGKGEEELFTQERLPPLCIIPGHPTVG